MRHRLERLYLLLLSAVLVAGLSSCGKSSPHEFQPGSRLKLPTVQPTVEASTNFRSRAAKAAGENELEASSWLEAAREDPDPRVRLHAIETWAAKPDKTLDPVTYALVDPDETVRARAQELFEEALERK